jgi:arylsulfatase A-like enzyme
MSFDPSMSRAIQAFWVLALFLLGCSPEATESRWARANIVWISFDSVRADHCSFAGYGRPTTVQLERLAHRGAVFTNCVAQAPYTLPSYSSMLSSRWVADLAVRDRNDVYSGSPIAARAPALEAADELLPEVLQAHGYRTAAFVQNWLGPGFGFDQGWDLYRYQREALRDKLPLAVDWIKAQGKTPFFAFIYTTDTHYPYLHAHQEEPAFGVAASPFRVDEVSVDAVRAGGLTPTPDELAAEMARYDLGLQKTDADLAPLFAALEQQGLMEHTIVVFNADHGEEFFEHGVIGHGQTYYEPTVRVPLIIAAPGLGSGQVFPHRVRNLDIAPTLLSLVGIDVPSAMRGEDLSPILLGARRGDLPAYSEAAWSGWIGAAYRRNVKLVMAGSDRIELYDLAADPGERHDLAPGQPNEVAALRRRLIDHLALADRELPRSDAGTSLLREILEKQKIAVDSPEYAELKALGYVH